MAKKTKNGYIVPKREQESYRALVNRANANVKSNLDYIKENNIQTEKARRALVKWYDNEGMWNSKTKVFGSSFTGRKVWDSKKEKMITVPFKDRADYLSYKRELQRFGGIRKNSKTFERSPAKVLSHYRNTLLDTLHSIADQYTIPVDVNQSQTLKRIINKITLDEIVSFYDYFDIAEEAAKDEYESGKLYGTVTTEEEFIDVTLSIMNVTREMIQGRGKKSNKPKRKKKKRAKKTKKRKI